VLLFTMLPPILAHGGVATTDRPFTACLVGALMAFTYGLKRPTLARTVTVGFTGALALLTK
jgi:4-amino-4-deoxy-L-arabinose transferase-like glycosyltransferase